VAAVLETVTRANELLALDVEDLDLSNRRARIRSKSGAVEWVFWQTGSAQLLPRLLTGRTRGAGRRVVPGAHWVVAASTASFGLTHAAEDGTNLSLLLARSRHASVRSLERSARPGPEAVARHLAETDPARRRP
jgi:integrase/recombinase XerD